jgi:uncharacterized protein (TIGR02246 family)
MALQEEAQVNEVKRIGRRLEAAFNARDPAALAALYTEDAVLMPPSEPMVQGRRAIRLWFDQTLPRLGMIRLWPATTSAERELAVQVGRFEMTPSAVSDSPGSEHAGKYVLVLTRADEGWAIAADLWNLDRPLG